MAVSMAVLVLSGASGWAATISNRDDKEQNITIIEGDAKADRVLKPLQVLEKICPKGCVLRLNGSDDDEYEIEPQDVVSIEDGYLYYDAPEVSPQGTPSPAPGTAPAQPPAKL